MLIYSSSRGEVSQGYETCAQEILAWQSFPGSEASRTQESTSSWPSWTPTTRVLGKVSPGQRSWRGQTKGISRQVKGKIVPRHTNSQRPKPPKGSRLQSGPLVSGLRHSSHSSGRQITPWRPPRGFHSHWPSFCSLACPPSKASRSGQK